MEQETTLTDAEKNKSEPQVVESEGEEVKSDPSEDLLVDPQTLIMVEGGSFYYKPNEIKIKVGEKVKLTLNSVDMMHDFVIDALNIRTPIVKSGETGTVEFTVDTPGEYEFYCSVGQHRANGMVGKLIVE